MATVLINPTDAAITYTLGGEWKLVANGTQAGAGVISVDSGEVTLDSMSVLVYVK
jgi:hypothetical protein